MEVSLVQVELLIGLGSFTGYQTLINSECYNILLGSEARGANVTRREGKNPDHQLRSLNIH